MVGKRIAVEGWAYGIPTPMFELSTSHLSAFWWMADSCMAKIGEQGIPGTPSGSLSAQGASIENWSGQGESDKQSTTMPSQGAYAV